MIKKSDNFRIVVAAAGLLFMGSAYAFNMGNMMNPSKWMGGNKNQDHGSDYYGGPGYGGAPGYGGGPGYGSAPGYGYGGAPGYGPGPGYHDGPSGRGSRGSNPMGMMPNPMKMFGGNKN